MSWVRLLGFRKEAKCTLRWSDIPFEHKMLRRAADTLPSSIASYCYLLSEADVIFSSGSHPGLRRKSLGNHLLLGVVAAPIVGDPAFVRLDGSLEDVPIPAVICHMKQ